MSIDEIAPAVEISHAGFFHHLPDRNALAQVLIERQSGRKPRCLAESLPAPKSCPATRCTKGSSPLRLLAEAFQDIPGGYPGCILVSAPYQDRLFNGDVKAAYRRAMLFNRSAEVDTPQEPVDPAELADHVQRGHGGRDHPGARQGRPAGAGTPGSRGPGR